MEESFPRGGAQQRSEQANVKKRPKENENLFSTLHEEEEPVKKKKKNVVKENSESFRQEKLKKTIAKEPPVTVLLFKNLNVGMLMMGCVKEVKDFELTLSLPYGLTGYVQAINICEAYTKIISEQAEKEVLLESLAPLPDLYAPGMLVRCAVNSLESTARGYHSVKLSINPKDVNKALTASSLRPGMLLSGCVASSEDHGYLIDLGVVGVKAFLPRQKAQVFLKQSGKGATLRVGQYLNCLIDEVKSDGRIVRLSITQSDVAAAIATAEQNWTLHTLMPGLVVKAKVTKVSTDKITLSFLSSYTGTVDFLHFDPKKSSTYSIGQEVKACILWVNRSKKAIHLTLRQSFLQPGGSLRQLSSSLTGSVLENCTVKSLFKSAGAVFRLDDETLGFAFNHNLAKPEENKNLDKFKEGTSHTVRVLEFSPVDETLFVSLKTNVVEGVYLWHGDLKAGQLLEGTVMGIEPVGMEVKVTSHITGLVPRLHLSDVPLHHPELKYKKGLSIRCRILTVVPSARKLILTRKKTIINSKLPIISSYQDAQPGKVTHGFIVSIKNYGCVVKFYNEVQGLAVRNELSSEHIPNPEETFYIGQVVKVRVLDCDPVKERMTLSFRMTADENTQKPERKSGRGNLGNLEIGKVVDVKIVQKTETGLDVVTLPEEKPAFLPKMHLSDHVGNCELLWHFLEEGDQLPGLMHLSRVKGQNILTKKSSLISSVLNGQCVKEMSELQIGMVLTGFVKTIMSYGIFVAFPFGLVGLAPNSAVNDKFVPEISEHFTEGQTLVAKVTETDEVKKRFLLTLKKSECAPDDLTEGSFSLLSQCFSERQLLRSLINRQGDLGDPGHISTLVPGKKLNLVVDKVEEDGSVLFGLSQIPGAKRVSAAQHHTGGTGVVSGQKANVVVLYVDALKSEVFVSLDKTLLSKKKDQLTENSRHFAVVQHLAGDFAVVSLEVSAHLAAIPVISHFNDTFQSSSEKLHVGQRVCLTLKTTSAEEHGLLLAIKNISGKRNKKGDPKGMPAKCMENGLHVGEVVAGTVKTIKPNNVIVSITDKVVGFIHVSQIMEDPPSGSCPTARLQPNQSISCQIIGGRDIKTHRFLPISHPNFKLSVPELSILPNLMNGDCKVPPRKDVKMYTPGQSVTCYVAKYNKEKSLLEVEVTQVIRGRIEQLLLCHSLKVLKRPDKHFKQGQVLSATVVGVDSSLNCLRLSLTGSHELKDGDVVIGCIKKILPCNGVVVSLPFGKTGKVELTHLSDCYADAPLDSFTPGKFVRCCVLSASSAVRLSLRESRIRSTSNTKVVDPEITSVQDLEEGQLVNGFVEKITEKGVFFRLSSSLVGHIQFKNVTDFYVHEQSVYAQYIPEGKLLTAKVIGKDTEENHVQLSLLSKDTGNPDVIPESAGLEQKKKTEKEKNKDRKRKRATSESESKENTKKKAKKKSQEKTEDEDSGVEIFCREEGEGSQGTKKAKKNDGAKPRLQVPSGFSWDVDVQTLKTSLADVKDNRSDSEDEEEEQPKTKKTVKEKALEKKEAEKELSKMEAMLLDPNRQPQSADDFDRLVISSPNSSILWLQYMAFHLHATEIEKARAVAERALKTISFREEQEKLNVWVAFLNLENMYGSEESLLKVFERAIQYNEPIKAFLQMADIYIKSEKFKQAEDLFNTMLKRFRQESTVWLKYATFLLKQGQAEATHRLLQRALKCLPDKEHVDVITKFAQLEFHLGDVERAKALFESTLSNYPKRTDLWSVYIDLMMKHGSQKEVRDIFERVIHLSLAAKRIKFFFKRYLEYEKKHGTAESIQAVKEKALKYVESKSSLTST